MIHPTAPMLTADLSMGAGKGTGAAPNGAANGSFSAILNDSGAAPEALQTIPLTIEPGSNGLAMPIAGTIAGGKESGKILPDGGATAGSVPAADIADPDAELTELPELDANTLALGLAGILSFPAAMQPVPLPLADAARSATAASTPASQFVAAAVQLDSAKQQPAPPLSSAGMMSRIAPTPAQHSSAPKPPAPAALAMPAVTLGAIEVVAANPQPAAASAAPSTLDAASTISAQLAARPLPIVAKVVAPSTGTPNAESLLPAAAVVDALPASPPAKVAAAITVAPNVTAADAATASIEVRPAPVAASADVTSPAVPSAETDKATTAAQMAVQPKTLAQPGTGDAASRVTDRSGPTAKSEARSQAGAEKTSSIQTEARTAAATPFRQLTEAAPMQVQTPAAPAEPGMTAADISKPGKIDGPQDFATLVSRLTEAREAATPHIVRTALAHPEFGQISMQFRQDDNAMTVTLANSDPAFAGAVHSAANAAMNGDTAKDNAQQQQQQSQSQSGTSSQQQAAAGGGTGTPGGQQQQQARADQAGQSTNRGQGSATRASDQEQSAEGRSGNTSRQSNGIYA
jgi:hypothetical protein